ncbi:hypothetical protein NK6_7327 [Bradyrhizobium diazoefficiens]|uniref:Uncharacterized protein n=1 Tax=Bradyrhizobium diazoefficiens TaxID=1355477 RepID=A0A0E4G0J2_9BRAD|nr:hypothetical protein NK6_7327 [Bradyrhizobium diazoefficiens]
MPDIATLKIIEGQSQDSANVVLAQWKKTTYDGRNVYTDSGPYKTPFNCASACDSSGFFQVINIQPDAITPKTADSPATATATRTISGQAVIISASVININGIIQAGSSSNYSVNIGAAAYDAIYGSNGLKNRNGGADFAAAQANARNGVYYDISGSVTASASGDAKIGVRYNALTDQLILNGVAQGAGGYVYLNGKIISTSTDNTQTQGNIEIKGGAGTVTVNNTSGLQLVTPSIPASLPRAWSRSSTSSRGRRRGGFTIPRLQAASRCRGTRPTVSLRPRSIRRCLRPGPVRRASSTRRRRTCSINGSTPRRWIVYPPARSSTMAGASRPIRSPARTGPVRPTWFQARRAATIRKSPPPQAAITGREA